MAAEKILLVCNFFTGGGTEQVALNLLKAFKEWNMESLLVAFQKRGDFVKNIPPDVRVFQPRINRRRIRFRFSFFLDILFLKRVIVRERPALLVSIIMHENIKTILAAKFIRRGPPVMVIDQTSILGWVKHELPRWNIWKRLIPKCYRRADAVVTASQGIASELAQLGVPAGTITTIHNPVDMDAINKLAQKKPAVAVDFNGADHTIVSIGGLRKQKGYPYLFRALAEVNRSESCQLLVIGDGPDRETLHRLSEELALQSHIHFLGFQENPYTYLKRSDIFVLASLWEGFGIVIIEAMACGIPVIATDCPEGPGEIIQDRISGRLVPPADPSALAAAITELLRQETRRRELALNAGRRARDFDLTAIMEKYRRLIQILIP